MTGVSINGIVLVADDFEAQLGFYRDTIGLELVSHWGDAALLRSANGVTLALFATTHDPRSMERIAPLRHGLSHLEFGATSAVQAELGAALDAAGYGDEPGNYLDPDGQLFHFVHEPDA